MLWRAAPGHALLWWFVIVVRGVTPALASVAFGWLVAEITNGASLAAPLGAVGVTFFVMVVALPLHQALSANLGNRLSAYLYDQLLDACTPPAGIAHLERGDLTTDLTMARDFDLGMMGPPLDISMDFISNGLVDLVVGASAAVLLLWFEWWAA